MKTLISIILFGILYNITSAQALLNPGTVELGGGITFSSTSENDDVIDPSTGSASTYNVFSIDPYIGFMVGSGVELGIKSQLELGPSSAVTFAGYFAPAYNFKTNSIITPYVEGLIGYATINEGGDDYSANGLGLGVGAGMKIMVGTKSLVLIGLQYIHQQYKYTEDPYFYNNNYYPYGYYQDPGSLTVNQNNVSLEVGFRLFFGGSHGMAKGAAISPPHQ